MAIKRPAWVAAQGGILTRKGWKHPNRNEILLPKTVSQAEVDEWNGQAPAAEPVIAPEPTLAPAPVAAAAPAPEPVADDEWAAEDVDHDGVIDELESMTKVQLEELGREFGVELDRRKTRATLLDEMREVIDSADVEEESEEESADGVKVTGIKTPDRAGLIRRVRNRIKR